MRYWIHLAAVSGGVLYVMPLLMLVVLAVAIERCWVLAVVLRRGQRLGDDLARADPIRAGLLRILEDAPAGPQQAVLAACLASQDSDSGAAFAEEAMLRQATALDRGLWILDTAVTAAPLLGLLGTIIGMFHAFQLLGDNGPPAAITGHVAEALMATAAGLLIAILGLIFFNALNQRVRLALHQMETVKVMALNRLYRPRGGSLREAAQPVRRQAQGA